MAATALRALTFVLVLLTLMQPVWDASTRAISVVYALDVSSSIAPGFLESALEWIRNANREYAPASARYVVFAQRPILVNDLEQVPRVAVTDCPRGQAAARCSRALPTSNWRWTKRCSASTRSVSTVSCS